MKNSSQLISSVEAIVCYWVGVIQTSLVWQSRHHTPKAFVMQILILNSITKNITASSGIKCCSIELTDCVPFCKRWNGNSLPED